MFLIVSFCLCLFAFSCLNEGVCERMFVCMSDCCVCVCDRVFVCLFELVCLYGLM